MMKDCFKLFIKCILISLPLVMAAVFAFIDPMGYMTQEYVLWREEKDYVNNALADPLNTVIIGDSRAKSSIIPKELKDDMDIYNIGIGGATSIEMYYATRNFIKNSGAPKKAVVIFAPYHFCDIDNWDQTLFTNYLSISETAEVYMNALRFGEKKIVKKGSLSDILSFKLYLPSKYLAQMYEERFTGASLRNHEKYDTIRKDLGYCEFGSDDGNDGVNYEVHHEYFDSSKLVLFYYDRLLELLSNSGTQIHILQAPINEASSKEIHPEFLAGYGDFLDDVQKRYPGAYVERDLPVYDNGYFGDNNHLNRKGAEKYTSHVKNESGL